MNSVPGTRRVDERSQIVSTTGVAARDGIRLTIIRELFVVEARWREPAWENVCAVEMWCHYYVLAG
jgi:hypothetical protein